MYEMTPREEAISDCLYALSLSETALNQHLDIWLKVCSDSFTVLSGDDVKYSLTLQEIKAKLYTDECLLTKEK